VSKRICNKCDHVFSYDDYVRYRFDDIPCPKCGCFFSIRKEFRNASDKQV